MFNGKFLRKVSASESPERQRYFTWKFSKLNLTFIKNFLVSIERERQREMFVAVDAKSW